MSYFIVTNQRNANGSPTEQESNQSVTLQDTDIAFYFLNDKSARNNKPVEPNSRSLQLQYRVCAMAVKYPTDSYQIQYPFSSN